MSRVFQISVSSNFPDLWRYNVVVMCASYDAQGEQLSVSTQQSSVASAGEDVERDAVPAAADREVVLTTEPCDSIKAYIYLMPHTLPSATAPDDTPNFSIRIKVKGGGEPIYNKEHQVNQWSGATIELKLPKKE